MHTVASSDRADALDAPRRPTPLDRLAAQKDSSAYDAIDWTTPIDRARWFVCETQTPLFYTGAYEELTPDQRRRYNQLTGMLSNELIALLETELLTAALRAIEPLRRPDGELIAAVRRFRDDERPRLPSPAHLPAVRPCPCRPVDPAGSRGTLDRHVTTLAGTSGRSARTPVSGRPSGSPAGRGPARPGRLAPDRTVLRWAIESDP